MTLEDMKKSYVVDEQNRKIGVLIDMETFNKIEDVLENYALTRLMKDDANGESLDLDEALAYYQTLEKAD